MTALAGKLEDFRAGITAIDCDYVRPRLAASHLVVDDGRAAFVDTGTTHSLPNLLCALGVKGIDPADVDWVLTTHVHLDHAGGAGALMQLLPNARCAIHPRGARHLVEPAKLVAGSIAVYGEERYRALYGEIVPIEAARVFVAEDGAKITLGARELELIHTPGHALHHYCVVDAANELDLLRRHLRPLVSRFRRRRPRFHHPDHDAGALRPGGALPVRGPAHVVPAALDLPDALRRGHRARAPRARDEGARRRVGGPRPALSRRATTARTSFATGCLR